jgi:hypothetical protein
LQDIDGNERSPIPNAVDGSSQNLRSQTEEVATVNLQPAIRILKNKVFFNFFSECANGYGHFSRTVEALYVFI